METDQPRSASLLRTGLAAELALFRQPKVALAVLALIFVPALYALIYVSSVWDPYGNLQQLPAALVNQDVAVTRAGKTVSLGAEVVATLEQQHPFAFQSFDSPESARAAVRAGKVYFALMIPPDFSARALAAQKAAPLNLYISEGTNFTASVFGQRFGLELAHTLNEKVGEERWKLLVGAATPSDQMTLRRGLAALQAGGQQLSDGATQLHDGTQRLQAGLSQAVEGSGKLANGSDPLAAGATRLADGMQQVKAAVSTIRTKLPDDGKLHELSDGSRALVDGSRQLNQGFVLLQQGSGRLTAGTVQMQEGSAKVPIVGGKLSAGAGQLHAGSVELGQGIDRAATGAGQLGDGLVRLDAGIQPLSAGLIELNAGLKTLDEKLPPTDQLTLFDRSMGQLRDGNHQLRTGLGELKQGSDKLENGAGELAQGAKTLAAGLQEAATQFEAGFGGSEAHLLAAPVESVVEKFAPVPNNGPAFAPYFCALSLWVGSVMMSFIFFVRRLPDFMAAASQPTRWLTKALPLLVIGTLQASVIVAVLGQILAIHFAHPLLVWLVAVAGSLTFVSIVVGLIAILGDAGRLLAVILLIFQLAASGGIYPIQLSSTFYQQVHGYLPFTFLVRALRAVMFGAFDDRCQPAMIALGVFAVAAILAGGVLARWKFIAAKSYGPAVDF